MQRVRVGLQILDSCRFLLRQGERVRAEARAQNSGCNVRYSIDQSRQSSLLPVLSSSHAHFPSPPYSESRSYFSRAAAAAATITAVTAAATYTGWGLQEAHTEGVKQGTREFPTIWFGFQSGFQEAYDVGKEIGQGSFGLVRICQCKKTKNSYAVKVLDKLKITNAEGIEDIDREVELLTLVRNHKNVINLIGAYEDSSKVYLVMELCSGGDIYDKIDNCNGRLTESDVAEIVFQMLSALAHCHLKGVVLCDVKPDNFLFTTKHKTVKGAGPLRAIDLGLSRRFVHGKALRRAAGTAYFVAPEVLRYEYGPESDLWSVGVIAFLLLSGGVPFDGDSEREILKKVVREEPSFDGPQWQRVSAEAKNLVACMLTRDAAMRPSAAGALSHPWFRAMNKTAAETPLDSAVLSALQTFASSGRMRKMALRAMARETVSEKLEAVLQLEQQFKAMDVDHTGMISFEELRSALRHSALKHTDAELGEMLHGIDLAGEGEINYLEFVAAAINLHQLAVQNQEQFERLARAAFEKFDLDKSGYFTASELKEALQTTRKCYSQGSEVTDQFVADLIAQVDTDGDGKVSFEEFLALLHTDRPESYSRYGWIKNPKSS